MRHLKLTFIFAFAGSLAFASCEKKIMVQHAVPYQEIGATASSVIQDQDLPENVKAFLKKYYPDATVTAYEIKTIPEGKKYEVKLNNGAEIDFDNDGNWEEISDKQGIPEYIIPKNIQSYVSKTYPGIKIESIDKEQNKIKVELLNDLDLEFDLQGNFLRIDP